MEKLELKASPRELVGKKVKKLRANGKMPAVLYGHDLKPQAIELNTHDFERIFSTAGHNTILDLKIEGDKGYNVLIHEVALDSVRDNVIHADLYRVKMDEVIRTSVPIHFTGESVAVFQEGGSLLTNLEEIEIETLPANLPANIEVDISILDDFDKTITVADLNIPAEVKVLSDAEELVARVEPPRSDEELAKLDEEIGDEVPEAMKEEGEEGEEGEQESSEGEQNE